MSFKDWFDYRTEGDEKGDWNMPYIKEAARDELANGMSPDNPGELNYAITMVLRSYYTKHRGYQSINDILGALEGAKLEFYRRIAGPYEDKKITENGDVY